ncbi:MAG: NAD(+) diphosphatase [Candidatus Heritagella sp.]
MIQEIAPHRFDITYRPDRTPQAEDYLLMCEEDRFCLCRAPGGVRFPLVREWEGRPMARYLFSIDGRAFFFAPKAEAPRGDPFFHAPASFFRRGTEMAKPLRFAGVTAWQLIRWYREHLFCSACGHPTSHSETERMIVCPRCGRTVYPQIAPALILAVTDGDRLLMSRYRGKESTRPLGEDGVLLAGYMEAGETPEDAARREIWEETGVRVKNLRYYRSQPWGYSDTLLLGFTAELDGDGTITLQEDELSAAGWVPRGEIVRENEDFSLTNEMILAFMQGRL